MRKQSYNYATLAAATGLSVSVLQALNRTGLLGLAKSSSAPVDTWVLGGQIATPELFARTLTKLAAFNTHADFEKYRSTRRILGLTGFNHCATAFSAAQNYARDYLHRTGTAIIMQLLGRPWGSIQGLLINAHPVSSRELFRVRALAFEAAGESPTLVAGLDEAVRDYFASAFEPEPKDSAWRKRIAATLPRLREPLRSLVAYWLGAAYRINTPYITVQRVLDAAYLLDHILGEASASDSAALKLRLEAYLFEAKLLPADTATGRQWTWKWLQHLYTETAQFAAASPHLRLPLPTDFGFRTAAKELRADVQQRAKTRRKAKSNAISRDFPAMVQRMQSRQMVIEALFKTTHSVHEELVKRSQGWGDFSYHEPYASYTETGFVESDLFIRVWTADAFCKQSKGSRNVIGKCGPVLEIQRGLSEIDLWFSDLFNSGVLDHPAPIDIDQIAKVNAIRVRYSFHNSLHLVSNRFTSFQDQEVDASARLARAEGRLIVPIDAFYHATLAAYCLIRVCCETAARIAGVLGLSAEEHRWTSGLTRDGQPYAIFDGPRKMLPGVKEHAVSAKTVEWLGLLARHSCRRWGWEKLPRMKPRRAGEPTAQYLFCDHDRPMTRQTANGLMTMLAMGDYVIRSPHDFRHARAEHSLAQGQSIRDIGDFLDHSGPEVTYYYADAFKQCGS